MPSQGGSGRTPRPRIGRRLTELLDEGCLTHRDLAVAIGVHEQNVSRWVRGVTGPYPSRLRAIAGYFEVAPRSLFDTQPEVLMQARVDAEPEREAA